MISSTRNSKIVEARKLTQRKHRQRQDRFLVEGLQLLGLAIEMTDTLPGAEARIVPQEVFYCEALFTGDTAPQLLARLEVAGGRLIPVAANVMDSLSERDTSQGLAATFLLSRLLWPPADFAAQAGAAANKLVLVLDRLQDPGNLGTLIRTADGVAAAGVLLLEPCVDPFDPKTVRSTMGSIFSVPLARLADIGQILPDLTAQGYRLIGADAHQGQPVWRSEALAAPTLLALGNEARGLSPGLTKHLVGAVTLPLRGHAESLNVAVAGGVLLYEWLRVNQKDGA